MDSAGEGPSRDADRLADHPDLGALGRRLRHEMDDILRAEQYAARIAAQRRSTIRDRLLLAEDRAERVHIEVVGGSDIHGVVSAVGADHVVLDDSRRQALVALQHVVAVRRPTR